MSEVFIDSNVTIHTDDRRMLNLFITMKSTRSPQTAKTYMSTLERFISQMGKPCNEVTLSDIIAYQQSIDHLAPTTQKRMLTTIRSWFNFLSAQPGYLIANPMAVFENPRTIESDEIEHVMTKEDVEKIRNVLRFRNFRNYVVVSLLCSTGIRLTELLTSTWDDVSQDMNGHIGLTVLGKGKRRRTVKLTPQLFSLIVEYRTLEGLDCEIGSGDDTPLFVNRRGESLTSRYVEQFVSDAGKLAGLSYSVHPHLFRHFNATMALYKGANIHVVQRSLGHKSIATTNRYLYSLNKLSETTGDYVELD